MFGLELEQAERQSEVVVEVPFRAVDVVARGEQVGHGVLGGGLTHGTGDREGGLAPEAAHGRSESLQGEQRVIDREQAALDGIAGEMILANNGRNRAALQGLVHVIVAIEAVAFYREEQLTGLNGARIDGVAL